MRHTGHEGMLQRTIIGPTSKDFVDGGVRDGMGAIRRFRYGQTLPLHAGVEDPQEEVEGVVIAEFALGPTFGHAEVR